MEIYRCGDDAQGMCSQGLEICCGLCPKKRKCKDVCWFFEENQERNYRDCDALIILQEEQ